MEWFGDDWGADVCRLVPHVKTPTGERCTACGGPVRASDRGLILPYTGAPDDPRRTVVALHLDCFLRSIWPANQFRP